MVLGPQVTPRWIEKDDVAGSLKASVVIHSFD